jgi:histidyl-tRNA synthetase
VPRKQRLFVPGLPLLLALKGNNSEKLFREESDRQYFLQCLANGCGHHPVQLHAYCLLDSQVFLLLTAGDKTALARFIQYLGRCYVSYFNRRHGRSGVLWEGRYRSCSIEPGSYFLLCQKYLDTQARRLGQSGCSSSAAYRGEAPLDFLQPHPAYLSLAADSEARQARYQRFLALPLASSFIFRIETCLQQNSVLGTLSFCLKLEEQLLLPVRSRSQGRPRKYYPQKLEYWLWLEQEAKIAMEGLGYQEIRLPLLESRDGDAERAPAQLRREGTMGCLTAIAARKLRVPARLWYQGPMFRTHHLSGHQVEQFHQIGAEALGFAGIDIEFEQLLLQYDLMQRLGLSRLVELQINTLGTQQELQRYRQRLRGYFSDRSALNPRQQAALERYPETLLSAAAGLPVELIAAAPAILPELGDDSLQRFLRLSQALQAAGVPHLHRVNLFPQQPYYQHTFYEWHSTHPDSPTVLCCGGRYDELASRIMARPSRACGFAFMVEPLIQLAQQAHPSPGVRAKQVDIVIACEQGDSSVAMMLGQDLRAAFPYLVIVNDYAAGRSLRKGRRRSAPSQVVIGVHAGEQRAAIFAGGQKETSCPLGEVTHRLRALLQ